MLVSSSEAGERNRIVAVASTESPTTATKSTTTRPNLPPWRDLVCDSVRRDPRTKATTSAGTVAATQIPARCGRIRPTKPRPQTMIGSDDNQRPYVRSTAIPYVPMPRPRITTASLPIDEGQ